MKRIVLLACLLITAAALCAQDRIQIVAKQTLEILCTQADEVTPQRKLKIKFLLLNPAAATVNEIIEIGANAAISAPAIPTPTINFPQSEFPLAGQAATTVEKEVTIQLSTGVIDKAETMYLYLQGKPSMGVVQLNITCDKKKVIEATAISLEQAKEPAKPVANEKADANAASKEASKAPCECMSILRGTEAILYTLINKDSGETADRSVPFKIVLKRGCRIPNDTVVKIKLVAVSASPSEPQLITQLYPIKKEDWPTNADNESKQLSFTTYIRIKNNDSLDEDKLSYLALDKCTEDADNRQVIREITRGLFNPNKPFWVEAGANFDLLNELKPNNFFGGVFLYRRDLGHIFRSRKKSNNLSLFGGMYNSKSVTEDVSTKFSPLVYFDPNRSLRPIDTTVANRNVFWAFADSGKVKTTITVRNVGLFFSPQMRITQGNANADGLHLFTSLWIEMVWQRFSTTYDFEGMRRYDSFPVRVGNDSFKAVNSRPISKENDIRSHYFGAGFPLFFKYKEVNLYFSPVFGVTNQRLAPRDSIIQPPSFTNPFYNSSPVSGYDKINDIISVVETPKKRWNWFYLFQFRLNEDKYGLALTGEVRGLFLKYYKPLISFALSKKFDLDKLLTFGLLK